MSDMNGSEKKHPVGLFVSNMSIFKWETADS